MPNPTPERSSDSSGEPSGDVRRATRWNAAGKGVLFGVRWIVRLWLLTLVPVADIGIMSVAVSISGFLTFFSDFGTGQAVIQRKKLDSGFLSTVFWTNFGLGMALSGLLWLGCAAVDSIRGPSEVTRILPVLGLSFVILSFGIVQKNLLARRLQFGRVALVNLAEALGYGSVAIWLAFRGHGVWALVYGTLAGKGVSVLASWVLGGWRPRWVFITRILREIWSFSTNLLAAQLTTYGFQQSDRFIIAALLGWEATGYYTAAQQLVLFPIRNMTQILVGVLVPALSKLQDDLVQLRDRLVRALSGIVLVIAPCLFGLAAVIHPLITGFLRERGGEIDKWGPALIPALFMIPASLLRAMLAATGSIYVSQGQTKLMFRWSMIHGVAVILAYFVGVPWGLPGVAAGFSLVHIILAPWLFGIPFGLIGLKTKEAARAVAPALGLALLMAAVAYLGQVGAGSLGASDKLRVVAGAAIGIVLYTAFVLGLHPPGARDLLRLLGLSRFARGSSPETSRAAS
jgi:O-antigen/teichoic acid export membrane protein